MSLNKDIHVVVWEKYEELTNSWYSFSPKDSNFIEANFSQKNLGINVSTKNIKNIDIEKFVELGPLGEIPIRRATYPQGCAAFNGIQWMWEDSQSWQPYSQIIIEFIEHNFSNNNTIFKLNIVRHLSNYTIDLNLMRQINNLTGYGRNVRRKILANTYISYTSYPISPLISQNFPTHFSFSKFTNGNILNNTNATLIPFQFGNISNRNSNTNVFKFNLDPKNIFCNQLSLCHFQSNKRSTSPVNSNDSTLTKFNDQIEKMQQFKSIPKIDFLSLQNKRKKTNNILHKITYIEQINIDYFNGMSVKEILLPFFQTSSIIPYDEDCVICCESLNTKSTYNENPILMMDDFDNYNSTNVIQFKKCYHYFHLHCIHAMYNNGPKTGCLKCPSCKQMYGIIIGNCPDGTMKWWIDQSIKLPSNQSDHTIIIEYNINPPKVKGDYRIQGFPRIAYLPYSKDGILILDLLCIAWQRRLTFTIGTSITTGTPNCVVWNEIHHKTMVTNECGHGYPDCNYFQNVISELASQGITESDIR